MARCRELRCSILVRATGQLSGNNDPPCRYRKCFLVDLAGQMLKKNKGKREKTMADDGRHWSGEFGASAAVTPKGGIVGRKPLAMP